jgi:uncharacterized protein involved in exopolysaccharide biosynthesis
MATDENASGIPAFVTDPIGVARRRWRPALAALVLGLAAAAVLTWQIPVTYSASATLLMTEQQIPEDYVQTTVGVDPTQRVDALVGEIVSRERLTPLIEKHNLYPERRRESTMADLVALARANVNVEPVNDVRGPRQPRGPAASVYTVSFSDGNPKTAAEMANDLATLFVAAASRLRGQQAAAAADFMRAELERSDRDLREQERLLAEFKEKYRGELPTELTSNNSRLERLALQRQTLVTQLGPAEARLADLESLGDLDNPSSPYSRLSALRAKLMSELAANTEEHPNVIALRRQIESLEAELKDGGPISDDPAEAAALRAARKEVADIKAQLGRIDAETSELEQRVARTPQREEEMAALTQKLTVLQDTYVENLRKLQSAELSRSVESAQQGARVEVIDRAVPPSEPERTRLTYLAAGIAASLAGAIGIAVLLELVDPVIVSASQIEEELALPVLGSVGRVG